MDGDGRTVGGTALMVGGQMAASLDGSRLGSEEGGRAFDGVDSWGKVMRPRDS